MKKLVNYSLIIIFLSACQFSQVTIAQQPKVKNVILLIGDGMGVNQVYAGILASDKPLNIERAKYSGFSKTYSANSKITDSGAGGTAIAIGKKTYNGAIGVDVDTVAHPSILVLAEEHGLSTGLIATCDITHATPASFIAHQPNRGMAQEIATDFLKTPVDVVIGGGSKNFIEREDNRNLFVELQSKGYKTITDLKGLQTVTDEKVFCLVNEEHLPKYSDGRGDYLPSSVEFALQYLSSNKKGFFVMIEGSQIDWGGHANDIEYIVDEMLDFDRAVGVAFDFADKNPGTLVIVTSDHETGGLTQIAKKYPIDELKPEFSTKGHSGSMVPVFTYGTGAEQFSGIFENTAIFDKICESYGWSLK